MIAKYSLSNIKNQLKDVCKAFSSTSGSLDMQLNNSVNSDNSVRWVSLMKGTVFRFLSKFQLLGLFYFYKNVVLWNLHIHLNLKQGDVC